jgi:F5/8 type C domain-containing protein
VALLVLAVSSSSIALAQEADLVLRPIRNVIATSNAVTADDDTGPENTVNGSGLNASGEHSTSAGDMWLAHPQDEPTYIQFEFDDSYELEEMWVWNFNDWFFIGGANEVTIEYSENGTDWTVFGNVECAEATGKDDYTVNTIIALEGIQARYVRLTILSTRGWLGLSEVRFWTFTETTYQIHNVVATSNLTSEAGFEPENTVNDTGMSANDGHSTNWTDMWIVDPNDGPVSIQFAFDGLYELEEMWVWNCNTAGFQAKDVTIEHSENDVDWTVLGDVQFARATLDPNCPATTFVSLNGIAARYIRLTIHSTWHDNVTWVGRSGVIEDFERRGLSEVRFFTKQPLSGTLSSCVLILDDFEVYGSGRDPGEPIIYEVWIDGLVNGTSSQVGYWTEPFVEQDLVHGGLQAMPLFYNNQRAPLYSEASLDLEPELQNWDIDGVDALTLYFHGSADKDHNAQTDRLYVALHTGPADGPDSVVAVHHPDPGALLNDGWQEWTIGFEAFGNVDLSQVRRLAVGIGDPADPRFGGNSIVYIDDIGLTSRAAQTDMEEDPQ